MSDTAFATPLPHWQRLPPPGAGLRAVVVLPARDEAQHVARAVEALAAQRDATGAPLDPASFEVLLFANNCSDDTALRARRAAARCTSLRLHVVESPVAPPHAHIGYVRRQLMDAACARLQQAADGTALIASTDADSVVAPDWLAANLAEAAAGADVIGGRIACDATAALQGAALRQQRLDLAHALLRARLEDRLDPDPADPWPRHHQHFGASLAITTTAYRRAGGVPPVEWLEDEALVRAARRAGLAVRHSPRVRVVTSGRLDGRAEVGLAWQRRQWLHGRSEWHDPPCWPPSAFAAFLRARALLRRACLRGEPGTLAGARLRLAPEELASGRPFGWLCDAAERAEDAALRAQGALVPMSQAVPALRALLRGLPGPTETAVPVRASADRAQRGMSQASRR